jgi:hypothetical protein
MSMGEMAQPGGARVYGSGSSLGGGHEPANLGDILERVLDRGLVIAGDIRVNLLDIELLTIKLRLIIASVETARELGIDWWVNDPWLSSNHRELEEENRRLRDRVAELEAPQTESRRQVTAGPEQEAREEGRRSARRR